jgi:hypothetical protein
MLVALKDCGLGSEHAYFQAQIPLGIMPINVLLVRSCGNVITWLAVLL